MRGGSVISSESVSELGSVVCVCAAFEAVRDALLRMRDDSFATISSTADVQPYSVAKAEQRSTRLLAVVRH